MTVLNGFPAVTLRLAALTLGMLSVPGLASAARSSPCGAEEEWCSLPPSYDFYATSYGTDDRAFIVTTQNVDQIPCSNTGLGDPHYYSSKHCKYIELRPKPAETFVNCAAEGGVCNVEVPDGSYRVVRYGSPDGNRWLYNNVASKVACRIEGFGYNFDPVPNVNKICQVSRQAIGPNVTQADGPGWISCAGEEQECTPETGSGTYLIKYGVGDNWLYRTVVGTGAKCNPTTFGSDPVYGQHKSCYYLPMSTVRSVTGQWQRLGACAGCEPGTFQFTWGVEKGNTRQSSSTWAQQVQIAVKAGIKVEGLGDASTSVTSTESFSNTASVVESYTQKTGETQTWPCKLGALWQFQTTVDEFCGPNSTSCSTTAKTKLFKCAVPTDKPSLEWTSEF